MANRTSRRREYLQVTIGTSQFPGSTLPVATLYKSRAIKHAVIGEEQTRMHFKLRSRVLLVGNGSGRYTIQPAGNMEDWTVNGILFGPNRSHSPAPIAGRSIEFTVVKTNRRISAGRPAPLRSLVQNVYIALNALV